MNAFVLPDHALFESVFHMDQLLDIAFHHPGNRYACPIGDNLRHILGIDLFLEHLAVLLNHLQV
ncbi:MAG: hypothetical protein A4E66_02594 [Syntrophus sp. PtaB.Bin001]|nr:MAG: hypothetical protein A4E66_02594 [Syntrophus sp. PtaB.Bin001]